MKKTKTKSTELWFPHTRPKRPRIQADTTPVLRFCPTAWAKLLYFRDREETEIGGFGITRPDTPLLVEEFVSVNQHVSMASVSFDDEAVADYFESQVDLGRHPEQFGRIWLHTHPGRSPHPSGTDEETFRRVFGQCQWAVMFILAREGECYARLQFNVGPRGHTLLPVEIHFPPSFAGSDLQAWETEYQTHIHPVEDPYAEWTLDYDGPQDMTNFFGPTDWLDDLEAMEPEERRQVLTDLSCRPDLWEEMEDRDEYL